MTRGSQKLRKRYRVLRQDRDLFGSKLSLALLHIAKLEEEHMSEGIKISRRKVSPAHYQMQVRWPGTEWVDLYHIIEHKGLPAPWGVHWISGATGQGSKSVYRFLTQPEAMEFIDQTIAEHIELEEGD